jgi:hypothetical protein
MKLSVSKLCNVEWFDGLIKRLFVEDLEGCGQDLIEVLMRHLPGGNEENHEKSQLKCMDRDSNPEPAHRSPQ